MSVVQTIANITGIPVLSPGGYSDSAGLLGGTGATIATYEGHTFHGGISNQIQQIKSELAADPYDYAEQVELGRLLDILRESNDSVDERWYYTTPD